MQTLSKTELTWIYLALDRDINTARQIMRESEPGCAAYVLAEAKRDGLCNVKHKIHTALNGNDKRIRID